MKIRSNYDFRTVEECKQDAKEMVNLLKMERTCGNAKERASRLNDEVYNRNCGYIKVARSSIMNLTTWSICSSLVTPSSVRVSVESTRANSKSLLLLWLTISMRSAKLTTTVFSLCVIVAAGLSMALAKTAKPLPLCRWREAIFSSSPSATLTVFALLLAGTRRSAVTDCKSMTTTSLSAKMVALRTSCLVTCSSSQRRSVPERSSARVSPKGRLFFYCHS